MTRGGGVVVRLKGLHKVRRKLADGSYRTHYYAWRGGPRVEGEPGTPEFVASYNRAVQNRRAPVSDTFAALVVRYKQSTKHCSLKDSSRREEARHLDTLLDEFGDARIAVFDDPRVRKDIREWHERMSATPRKADLSLGVLRKVLDFARGDGLILQNAATGHAQLHRANRAEKIWGPEDIERICGASTPELARVILMSAHSGMARIDLTRLRWSDIDEHSIQYKRSKTGELATVPIYPPIRTVLADTPRRGPIVFTNTRGNPWTADGIGTAFQKAKKKAGITDLRFHDLRGSAVTYLYTEGLSDLEVADIVGWSEESVRQIKKRYVSRKAVASALIERLKRTKRV